MLILRLLQGATNLSGVKMITESCNVWFPEKFTLFLGAVYNFTKLRVYSDYNCLTAKNFGDIVQQTASSDLETAHHIVVCFN
jgi:hypothetical protein